MVVSGDIASDTVWSGTVSMTGSVYVRNNAKLTIEPGTVIIAKAGTELDVGWAGEAAAIQAEGSAQQSIYFCGENDKPGVWGGIKIGENTNPTGSFKHVLIQDAGPEEGAALELATALLLDHVVIYNGAGFGMIAKDINPQSTLLNILKTKIPAKLTSPAAVTHFPSKSSLKGNSHDRVELAYTDIEQELNMRNLGVPYLQLSTVYLKSNATWKMAAGITYEIATNAGIDLGWAGEAAKVQWAGQAGQPIVLQAQSGSPGGWNHLAVRENTTADSFMQHLVVRHPSQPLEIEAPIRIEQFTLEDALAGIEIENTGLAPNSSMIHVRRVKGHPITAKPHALFSLPANGSFEANEKNTILIKGTDINKSGTLAKMPIPYLVESTLHVAAGAQLTVAAGSEFIMNANTEINFGWGGEDAGVTMLGTASEPIIFRGQSALPGYWQGLNFRESVRSDSRLEYVDLAHGGKQDRGLLDLYRAISVSNCKLHDSSGWGIRKQSTDTTDYATTNTFTNNASGAVGEL